MPSITKVKSVHYSRLEGLKPADRLLAGLTAH